MTFIVVSSIGISGFFLNSVIGEVRVHYELEGTGADVLILHGWGADVRAVRPIFQLLSGRFRVCSVDLPGFGESEMPPDNWTVYSYANFVAEFIEKVGLNRPILIGHSFGGRLAIILAGKKMVDINKMILVDSAGVLPKRGLDYYAKVYTYKALKKAGALLGKVSKGLEEKLKGKMGSADYRNANPTMRKIMVRVVNEDLTYLMENISVPTLLIWGENDDSTPVCDGKLMEKKMQDAGLVVLKGAGHFSYLDQFQEFSIIVNHFLQKDAGGYHA